MSLLPDNVNKLNSSINILISSESNSDEEDDKNNENYDSIAVGSPHVSIQQNYGITDDTAQNRISELSFPNDEPMYSISTADRVVSECDDVCLPNSVVVEELKTEVDVSLYLTRDEDNNEEMENSSCNVQGEEEEEVDVEIKSESRLEIRNKRGFNGRPKDPIWSKFKEIGDEWICTICNQSVSPAADRLRSHYKKCGTTNTKSSIGFGRRSSAGRPRDSIWSEYDEVFENNESKWICKICKSQVSPSVDRLRSHYGKCCGSDESSEYNGRNTEFGSGRPTPKDYIWSKFNKIQSEDGEIKWICPICENSVSPSPDRLQSHYSNCRRNNPIKYEDTKDGYGVGDGICTLCGDEFESEINEYQFTEWNSQIGESLNEFLGVSNYSQEKLLIEAKYCGRCSQLTRDVDFFIRSIRSLEIQLESVGNQLQNLASNNSSSRCRRRNNPFLNFLNEEQNEKNSKERLQQSSKINTSTLLLQRKRKMIKKFRGRTSSSPSSFNKNKNKKINSRISQTPKIEVHDYNFDDFLPESPVGGGVDVDVDDEDKDKDNNESPSESEWSEYEVKKPKVRKYIVRQRQGRGRSGIGGLITNRNECIEIRKRHKRLGCLESGCNFTCNKKENLDIHIRTVHLGDAAPYHCISCEKKYKSAESLAYHVKKRHETLPVPTRCPVTGCLKDFATPESLESHLKVKHHGFDRKKCEFCGLSFSNEDEGPLEEHVKKHREAEVPYSCVVGECISAFTNSLDLRRHVTQTHEETTVRCELCPSLFRTFAALRRHKHVVHNEGKPKQELKCSHPGCNYTTLMHSTLTAHIKTHSEERPYMCDECGSTYKNPKGLKQHMFLHTGELPYKCKYCDKAFNLPLKLKNHEETHAPTKTYLCSGCGKAFRAKNNLQQHQYFHCPQLPKRIPPAKKTPRKPKQQQNKNPKGGGVDEIGEEINLLPHPHPHPSSSSSSQPIQLQLPIPLIQPQPQSQQQGLNIREDESNEDEVRNLSNSEGERDKESRVGWRDPWGRDVYGGFFSSHWTQR